MHELLKHVLNERDLTRAGDIFAIPDADIVDDLNEVLKQITEISSRADYCRNDRDQALIEICVTRVTSCIKETGTLEKYCGVLVALLESCLHHNLMPLGHLRDDDPPHAKIASDIIACIVLVSFPVQAEKDHYSHKNVMELFLPVAVQFLHKGNREISRHMARYLSLAAVHHAVLLKPHVQTIMDSIMSGNYPLCRILTNLYEVCPEPLESHATALVSLLPHAEPVEKSALFALLELVAARRPEALRACVPQLLSYLCPSSAPPGDPGCMCVDILQVIVCVSRRRASLVREHAASIERAGRGAHGTAPLAAAALALLGYSDRERAAEALSFVLEQLPRADRGAQAALLREATSLCSAFPALFTDKVLAAVRAAAPARPKSEISTGEVNRTSGGVTIVKLGGSGTGTGITSGGGVTAVGGASAGGGVNAGSGAVVGYTRRAKLGDSRSTGRLHAAPHRSITRLNLAGGSVGGLHKSMTRLSSSQQINSQQAASQHTITHAGSGARLAGGGGVTVSGVSPPRPARAPVGLVLSANNNTSGPTIITNPSLQSQSISVNPLTGKSSDALAPVPSAVSVSGAGVAVVSGGAPASAARDAPPAGAGPVTVTSRRANNTSVTMINTPANANHRISVFEPYPMRDTVQHFCEKHLDKIKAYMENVSLSLPPPAKCTIEVSVTVTSRRANNTNVTMISTPANANHRISVFEPYPMRDTVQHFCEKHLDKIKAYMDNVSLRLPPPAKCTIEERRSKKQARLSFACGRRGAHCLYARALFSVRTRLARVWIHLMFLALQARHPRALSSRDPTVASLKHCWDILKCENKTFLTLVTSAFPGLKEQEMVANELRAAGFFDVFEVSTSGGSTATWGCFLCTHPERALGFLGADGQPVIEGQLKEKKGRWRLFRRWRTRYFTLSGAHLSCKGSSGGESIDINQIRSVKVSRGARNIPKAFEIFTGDQTLILKPSDGKNAEEWVQCLSIAVAHSHARDSGSVAKAHSLPARGLTLKGF